MGVPLAGRMSWLSPTHHSSLPHCVNARVMDTRGRHRCPLKLALPGPGEEPRGGAGAFYVPWWHFSRKKHFLSEPDFSALLPLRVSVAPCPWEGGASRPQPAWEGDLPAQVTEERFWEGGQAGAPVSGSPVSGAAFCDLVSKHLMCRQMDVKGAFPPQPCKHGAADE